MFLTGFDYYVTLITADPDADDVHDVCRRGRVPAYVGFAVVNTDVRLV